MNNIFHTAEFVFPGHPDKLSDAIADALVQEASRREKRALVGVEVAVHRNSVFVTGRIGCDGAEEINVTDIVKDVYRSVGYGGDWGPEPDELNIQTDLCLGPLEDGEAEFRSLSDDQSICTGYATAMAETNYLPVEHWLANRLGRRLAELRKEAPNLNLGPDGKVIVVIGVEDRQYHLDAFSCSLQQKSASDDLALHRAVRVTLECEMRRLSEIFSRFSPDIPDELSVNGAGSFEVGGPEGDNGLSGKKLVVDAYGPGIPVGGGALSGKDFFKVDRAGALHARRVAKAVVMTGAASEALVRIGWFPGNASARILSIQREGGNVIDTTPWQTLCDLSLEASGECWTNAKDLIPVAQYGHFSDTSMPWERIQIAPQNPPVNFRNNTGPRKRSDNLIVAE
ncbi:MAG: methionine adenosyltransferase domain-containing protein [Rhodospirillaceae bacterium]|nr:methionine adenosyltransferase domain-containing protein [Rhodospirillaceae bacterium]